MPNVGPSIRDTALSCWLHSVAFEFGPYEPFFTHRVDPPVERVAIRSVFSPTEGELVLDTPDCQAIE
jgi:hypothetical protein